MNPETFIAYSRHKLADHHAQIRRCVALCTPAQVWHRVNGHSNSIGNLLLHLRGNVHQWIVSGLGGHPFQRDRAAEFAQREPLAVGPMLEQLAATLTGADAVIAALSDEDLARPCTIQGYTVSGLEAVYHVVEHFAFHTGQIVTMTKALLDIDLSLYDAQGRRRTESATGRP